MWRAAELMTQFHLLLSHWALPLLTDDRIQLLCLEPLGLFSRLCILSCSLCSQAQQIAFNFKKLPQHYSSQIPTKIPITDIHISPLVTLPLTKLSQRDAPSISPSEMSFGPCCFLVPHFSLYHAGHYFSALFCHHHLRVTQLHGSPKCFPVTAPLHVHPSPNYWQSLILREDDSPERYVPRPPCESNSEADTTIAAPWFTLWQVTASLCRFLPLEPHNSTLCYLPVGVYPLQKQGQGISPSYLPFSSFPQVPQYNSRGWNENSNICSM